VGRAVKRALRVPSFAKINLGLEVLGVREDGTHELRTLFQTVDLADEIVLRPRPNKSGVTVACDHPLVPKDGTNLAARAAEALRQHGHVEAGVHIEITKRIPVGGGLGGGSSNAAAVLRGLDRLWRLGLGPDGLHRLASNRGAFLVRGQRALIAGRVCMDHVMLDVTDVPGVAWPASWAPTCRISCWAGPPWASPGATRSTRCVARSRVGWCWWTLGSPYPPRPFSAGWTQV